MNTSSALYSLGCRVSNGVVGGGRITGRPIFVTGNGRSGTTWLGETLARAPGLLYYREPCHPERNRMPPDRIDPIWSRYLPPDGRDPYFEQRLDAAFRGHAWHGSGLKPGTILRRTVTRPRILIKEVASFVSLEWVVARWDPEVLIILRHPAAYAASVQAMDQNRQEMTRFQRLRADPYLRAGPLADLHDHLAGIDDPLGAIAASWAIRTRTVMQARRQRHPDWRVIRYEDLAGNPVTEFRMLYDALGLEWSAGTERWIGERTRSDAPATATIRKSSDRIRSWKTAFSDRDIARLRAVLDPFDLPVYASDADWA
ncbi:hypothetical protein OCGS_2724 [Oceaniovalibus guishaninsula JLT2003]|uniref:Sulfotransferase n=1 Tax=Oceaniovalibus guishaninsula JLT2003 TaxID=1231392 RepID=K2H6D0_9RHOB|nr:sulfotransferase [Oceaniovalibus guishaninsula]EKE43133.1 hypothetical protein OCGS_2724 [Oceaniovalibus guishaninsula JLT2003]